MIPARYGSTRFPGKPLAEICNRTVIHRVYEQASKALETVVVATDDERIYDAVEAFGGKVVMTRADHKCGTDRCLEAYEAITTPSWREQNDTDTVIITHTEEGTCAVEQAKLLIAEGARPEKIQIGHVGTQTDLDYYKRILDTGVFIAFDRLGIEGMMGMLSDAERAKVVARLIREGYGGRILLSQDAIGYKKGSPTVRSGANADLIPNHHWGNIFSVFTPLLLEEGVSMAEIDRMLIDNPARLFGA